MLGAHSEHQTTLPGVPVRVRCTYCGCWMETAGEPVCSQCRSRGLLVELVRELPVACRTSHEAYEAHPNGAWGSMVGRLKTRLCDLAWEVEKEAGVEWCCTPTKSYTKQDMATKNLLATVDEIKRVGLALVGKRNNAGKARHDP